MNRDSDKHKTGRHVKVVFDLPREEDGYPPSGSEALWAVAQGEDRFVVDNIPFYVMGVSSGDVIVAAPNEKGQVVFRKVLERSGNSTFRLYVSDEEKVQQVRDALRLMGCSSELSDNPRLIAVEVPASLPIEPFLDYIVKADEAGTIEYQEAALRHDLP